MASSSNISTSEEANEGVQYRFGRPEVFTAEDKERVKRSAMPYIEQRVKDSLPIKQDEVLACIKGAGFAFTDLLTKYTKKQIYQRVRLEIRNRKAAK